MTGQERLEKVREALRYYANVKDETADRALDALVGCVLLTAEEAERARQRDAIVAALAIYGEGVNVSALVEKARSLALTPEGSDDA